MICVLFTVYIDRRASLHWRKRRALRPSLHVRDRVDEGGFEIGPSGHWNGRARQSAFAGRTRRIRVCALMVSHWRASCADCGRSYESLPPNFSLAANMAAGAFAGIAVRLNQKAQSGQAYGDEDG